MKSLLRLRDFLSSSILAGRPMMSGSKNGLETQTGHQSPTVSRSSSLETHGGPLGPPFASERFRAFFVRVTETVDLSQWRYCKCHLIRAARYFDHNL